MPEFELFQERRISGKGMLRVPSELAKRRAVVLYSDVLRMPKSPYFNFNYSPRRTKLGFLTFLREGYIIDSASIEYEQQSWSAVPDITAQNLIAIKCMYKGILQSYVNLAVGLNLVVVSVEDKIADYEYLDLMWDEVRVVCYADTALHLRLFALANDKCQDDADKPKKPPKPPPLPPPVPPGTPIPDLDPPYEDEDNPDNVTEPFEGDDNSPFPFGDTCVEYDINIEVDDIYGQTIPLTFRMFGEVEDVGIGGEGRFVYINCRGGRDSVDPPAGACLPEVTQCSVYGSTDPAYTNVRLLGYQEVV